MRYLSVCSGIEAATVAWEPLGWEAAGFAEIEKFPSAVLKHHYPKVRNFGDFTKIEANDVGAIDLLVGGTPCQDFSVAGLRAGMDGARGQLTTEFAFLARRLRPRWLVWENVPGVLSIDEGRAFGAFLGILGKFGYGVAYRVLDAQHFGIPQRRRRVFVVGHLGDWRRAAAVLFERHSLSGYPPPRREAGKGTTRGVRTGLESGVPQFSRIYGTDEPIATLNATGAQGGAFSHAIAIPHADVVGCMPHQDHGGVNTQSALSGYIIPAVTHSLRAEGFDASEDGTGRGTPLVPIAFQHKASAHQSMNPGPISPTLEVGKSDGVAICFSAKDHGADAMEDCSPTLRAGGHTGSHANAGVMPAVTYALQGAGRTSQGSQGSGWKRDVSFTLNVTDEHAIAHHMAVRRLTPVECERLQGFPDNYTKITEKTADGPRYKALGNSMAVVVMKWLAERIAAAENL